MGKEKPKYRHSYSLTEALGINFKDIIEDKDRLLWDISSLSKRFKLPKKQLKGLIKEGEIGGHIFDDEDDDLWFTTPREIKNYLEVQKKLQPKYDLL